MPKSDFIEAKGTVIKMQGHGFYLVRLDDNEHEILARMSGRMQKNHIRVIQLDRVELEISPADWSQARIVYRYK
jgi:translation initiation factor IF-1